MRSSSSPVAYGRICVWISLFTCVGLGIRVIYIIMYNNDIIMIMIIIIYNDII